MIIIANIAVHYVVFDSIKLINLINKIVNYKYIVNCKCVVEQFRGCIDESKGIKIPKDKAAGTLCFV